MMKKYNKYQDSKVNWLGDIPTDWTLGRLKDVSTLFGRIGFRGYSTSDIVDFEDGAITVSPSNMKNGTFDFTKNTYLSWEKYHESPEIKLDSEDVVMVKTGSTLGKVAFADEINYPSTINPQLMIFKWIKCNPKFLFYYLYSNNFQSIIPLQNTGSTIPTMTQEGIGRLPIPIPSAGEQEKIVKYLDKEVTQITFLIDKKKQFIESLKEKRLAVITNAVTKGINPNVKLKPSGIKWLGDIPEHWEAIRLKFLLTGSLKYGANVPAELDDPKLPRYVRITDVNSDGKLRSETFRSIEKEDAAGYMLKEGDILFARSGATVGKTFIYDQSWGDAAYAGYLIKASVNTKKHFPKFIYYSTKSNGYEQWIKSVTIQATIQNVSAEKYASLWFAVPPTKKEQELVAEFVTDEMNKINSVIEKMQNAVSKLLEYKTSLISAAVTGKIKVID